MYGTKCGLNIISTNHRKNINLTKFLNNKPSKMSNYEITCYMGMYIITPKATK